MKKSLLFNLTFVQSKKHMPFHGGGENDFAVLMAILNAAGNHPEWQIYGLVNPDRPFIRDAQPLLSHYQNLKFITVQELNVLKKECVFNSIYSSDINGLKWLIDQKLQSRYSMIVIHGLRRYELSTHFIDLFLPNRFRDKLFVLKSFFMRRWMNKSIEHTHQNIIAQMPKTTQLIATSYDTYYKLLALCPGLEKTHLQMLYTSQKIVNSSVITATQEASILKKYGLESQRYFLLISLGRIEKNVYFALKNLQRLYTERSLSFKTLASGELRSNFLINRFKKNPQINIQGYILGEELQVLYKHAFLFIYPTRSEGFGMPIFEAMEHGTPVLCSALSPLIEVGGDAAEYFSLNNDIEFRSKILKFCLDSDFYQQKRQQAVLRYQIMAELQIQDLRQKVRLLLHGKEIS